MPFKMSKAMAILLLFVIGSLSDNCAQGSYEIGDNWYCAAVKAIQYHNVGVTGSYRRVTAMAADGTCTTQSQNFSGPIAPFDEELSLHFRGPLQLKQFAAYTLDTSRKRKARGVNLGLHAHLHNNKQHMSSILTNSAIEDREPSFDNRQMVTATIDGVVQTWLNNYFGPSDAPAPLPKSPPPQPNAPSQPAAVEPSPPPTPVSSSRPSVLNSSPGQYSRIGYYDAPTQHLDGLTFLGNYGGSGSGVFDYQYGASLSYVSADGTTGAASPEILANTEIHSNVEVILMTDRICNGDCGFFRPNSVGYHGFVGADKLFLLEALMPHDLKAGFNGDMPAIWALNAQIPRSLQYGDPSCSCWSSGCGEFDIMEVLSSGAEECKSTIHTNAPAGDSDYIKRPISSFMKLAVVFNSANSMIKIQVLDDSVTFGPSLTSEQIDQFASSVPVSQLSEYTNN